MKPSARSVAISRDRVETAVHRQDGAEHRANAHQRGNAEANALDQAAQCPRLLGVVIRLAPHLHVDLRIGGQPVAERVEAVARVELCQQGLVTIAAAVGALQHARIAPDFGFADAAVGFEHTDHLPRVLPRLELVADREARELPARATADDDLVGAEFQHAPLDDRGFAPHRHHGRLHASHWDVRRGIGGDLWNVDDHVEFCRGHGRLAVAAQTRRLLDDVDFGAGQAAGHLAVGATAHHDRARRRAGALHRGGEARGDGQHRHQHDHHAGNADDGNPRRAESLGNGAEVEGGDRQGLAHPVEHVRLSSGRR